MKSIFIALILPLLLCQKNDFTIETKDVVGPFDSRINNDCSVSMHSGVYVYCGNGFNYVDGIR